MATGALGTATQGVAEYSRDVREQDARTNRDRLGDHGIGRESVTNRHRDAASSDTGDAEQLGRRSAGAGRNAAAGASYTRGPGEIQRPWPRSCALKSHAGDGSSRRIGGIAVDGETKRGGRNGVEVRSAGVGSRGGLDCK